MGQRRGGWLDRLRVWLGGGESGQPTEAPEADAGQRLDAARQRLKATIEPVQDEESPTPRDG